MNKLLQSLASLKLAVGLLVLLLLGLAAGTIIESRAGAPLAGQLVYYSWWFLLLQGAFIVNVLAAIANLFPWGKQGVGAALSFLISLFTITMALIFIKYLYKPEESQV